MKLTPTLTALIRSNDSHQKFFPVNIIITLFKNSPPVHFSIPKLQHRIMQSQRQTKHRIQSLKMSFLIFLIGLMTIVIWFVPPINFLVVLGFISILTACTYGISSYFLPIKRQIMLTSFVFLSLCMSYLLGFEVMNILLLLSFIIVVAKLFPNKKKIQSEKPSNI